MNQKHSVNIGAGVSHTVTHGTPERATRAARYLIRRVGMAGVYWQDTRAGCGQWGSQDLATRYLSTRAALPDGGEWVPVHVEIGGADSVG